MRGDGQIHIDERAVQVFGPGILNFPRILGMFALVGDLGHPLTKIAPTHVLKASVVKGKHAYENERCGQRLSAYRL